MNFAESNSPEALAARLAHEARNVLPLAQWSRGLAPLNVATGADHVRDSLAAIDRALRSLGASRNDARAESTRAFLKERRTVLSRKLELYQACGEKFEGPHAEALLAKFKAAHVAVEVAEENLLDATIQNATELRAALDAARGTVNAILAEVSVLRRELIYPRLVSLSIIEAARNSTESLAQNAHANHAVVMHAALDQGRAASADEARLWVAFEGHTDAAAQDLFALRWARFVAAHPEFAEVPAAVAAE